MLIYKSRIVMSSNDKLFVVVTDEVELCISRRDGAYASLRQKNHKLKANKQFYADTLHIFSIQFLINIRLFIDLDHTFLFLIIHVPGVCLLHVQRSNLLLVVRLIVLRSTAL